MEEDNLRDLMNRLRFATGKVVEEPVPEISSVCINSKCLLVIQQALCSHPALLLLQKTRDELKKYTMEQVQNSIQTEGDTLDDVGRLLEWMNETADTLEIERLSAVYHDPLQVLNDTKQQIFEEMGIEIIPKFSQYNSGDLSPWNVLLTLVSGPLLSFDEVKYKRVELHVPNPTPAMVTDLVSINKNVYNTTSWISLLNSLGEFPIKTIRHVWLAATFFFPTSGPIVVNYLRKEINELTKQRFLWEERDEDDAKETYRSYCRILNCFFRHFPLCFSVDLFHLFKTFLERFIRPDDLALDNVFRTALRRDIGHCPASAEVWKMYIRWKGDRISDAYQRREWIRKMYIRILRTPLHGLQEIKDDYDFFIKSEYRGKPPSEGRLEERFLRAKGVAPEISRFFGMIGGNSSSGNQNSDFLPRSLYLPRPVKLNINNTYNIVNEKEEVMLRLEAELWSLWSSIIDREMNSSAYMGIELYGYERLRFFLSMRISFFPHQPFCWISYIDYCLGQQSLLSEIERQKMARDILEKSSFLLPRNFYMQVAYCDYMLRDIADPESAHKSIKELLLQQRLLIIAYIKKENFVTIDKVYNSIENITLLSINWMRWGSLRKEFANSEYIRLIARFTMHRVDFLSLIMGVIRRASKEEKNFTPRRCQEAFNTFCHFWIKLELIRNQAKIESFTILKRWKDHLKMFLTSAKDKGWNLIDCGLDEYFISSCTDVCNSYPSLVEQVLEFLDELKQTIMESHSFSITELNSFLANSERIYDNFFVKKTEINNLSSFRLPINLFNTRLRGVTVPLQTYDHCFFSTKYPWNEEYKNLSQIEELNNEIFSNNKISQNQIEAMPDDAYWVPHVSNKGLSVNENTQYISRVNNENDIKWRKSKRPPNRRALISQSFLLKDLSCAIEKLENAIGGEKSLQKVEELIKVHLPSTYETDVLFLSKTIDTSWLLGFLEGMPALHQKEQYE